MTIDGMSVTDVTTVDEVRSRRRALLLNLPDDAADQLADHAGRLGLTVEEVILRGIALHAAIWESDNEMLHLSCRDRHKMARLFNT